MGADDSPALLGGFAPIERELVLDDLPVEGEIPPDLNGLYVRNGPNRQFAAPGRYHWFDGDGMLHAVRFDRGRVQVRNRWIDTAGLREERAAGHALWSGIKDPPRRDRPGPTHKNTANTDVRFHAGELLAMWYRGGEVYRCRPDDLSTLGVLGEDSGGDADGAAGPCAAGARRPLRVREPRLAGLPISAHSKVDERTGEFLFFTCGKAPPYMQYGVLDRRGALTTLMEIPLPGPRLPHDMAVTEHYTVLHDLPLHFDAEALAAGRHKLKFHAEQPSRFGVVPRHGGPVRWFEAAPAYLYHVGNAWEEGDEIVMTGTPFRLPRDARGAVDAERVPRMVATLEQDYTFHEWRFNLRTGQTRERTLDDVLNTEFPIVNGGYLGRPTRFSWHLLMGRAEQPEAPRFSGLARYDLLRGTTQAYHEGPRRWWSEAPFAPRDGAMAEDDGYLVGFVWDDERQRSQVCVMDASDLSRGPVCRITLPQRVPHGFHATWVSAAQLAEGGRGT
jgi:carotenoid cleavage dioxygenase-like enzyme